MTSGLETEWDYSGRKGRDGQKKKIGKANVGKGKVKRRKRWTREKRGAPAPHRRWSQQVHDVFRSLVHQHLGHQQAQLALHLPCS